MNTISTARGPAGGLSAVLAATEFFRQLSADERSALAAVCGIRRYRNGEQIFARGDPGTVMYIVASGHVVLSDSSPDGEEVVFDVLLPFRSFGELSLIDNGARIATATARKSTTLVCVPGSAVRRLLHGNPGFALTMLKALADLVRSLDGYLADRTLLDLRSRLIKYLVEAATAAGTHMANGPAADSEVHVDLSMTQTDLARLVGGSRQHVNRIIIELERQGAIRRQRTRVVGVRPQLLRRIAARTSGRVSPTPIK